MPPILGLNKLELHGGGTATLLANCQSCGKDWSLMAVRRYRKGRSLIWSTDIGPHWLSRAFLAWRLYDRLMTTIVTSPGQKDIKA